MADKPWPKQRLTAEQEAEARRRRIDDEPPMGAMGPHNKIRLFHRYEKPPAITVIVPDDEDDLSDLDLEGGGE